jgi:hypothetical protein
MANSFMPPRSYLRAENCLTGMPNTLWGGALALPGSSPM